MSLKMSEIFCFKRNEFQCFPHDDEVFCEDAIKFMCKSLNIAPILHLLFGLKTVQKNCWLPLCRKLQDGVKYEFRVRFKAAPENDEDSTGLRGLDAAAYNYFYNQLKHDLLNCKIPEIDYKKMKPDILSWCLADMYVEYLEKRTPIEELYKNYKRFFPEKIVREHSIFLKDKIKKRFKEVKKEHNINYVRAIYFREINVKAPNYLMEEYKGVIEYSRDKSKPVLVKFWPFSEEESGLNVYHLDTHLVSIFKITIMST